VNVRRTVHASPLILLSKAGRLEPLRTGAAETLVPEPVPEEIATKGDADPTLRAGPSPLPPKID